MSNTNLIILKDVPENTGLVVEILNLNGDELSFVHDSETGLNYFNQAVMSELFGVRKTNISEHLNNYLESIGSLSNNLGQTLIELKINDTGRPVKFYSFDALTYVAYRINTVEAIQYRNTLNRMLNKMFNVATGKDNIDTRNVKLQKILNDLSNKRGVYYETSQSLYSIGDKKHAKELYHLFKVVDNEYNKIYRLITDIRINNRDADIVLDKYNDNSKTEQTKLII